MSLNDTIFFILALAVFFLGFITLLVSINMLINYKKLSIKYKTRHRNLLYIYFAASGIFWILSGLISSAINYNGLDQHSIIVSVIIAIKTVGKLLFYLSPIIVIYIVVGTLRVLVRYRKSFSTQMYIFIIILLLIAIISAGIIGYRAFHIFTFH